MARRGQHTLEEIKNLVLNAAEELVVEGGLAQLRVRNIALKIGYTVGSIYMVFDNMNDLILQVKGRTLDDIVEQMDQIHAESAQQRLSDLASVYIHYASINVNRWSMVFEHRLPDKSETPEWYQKKLDNLFKKIADSFALIAPELSLAQRNQVAIAFLSSLQGICMFRLTAQIGGLTRKDWDESVALLIKWFVNNGCSNSFTVTTSPKKTKPQSRGVIPPAYMA
jgi:AcrR family transcriptional regulator